MNNVDLNGLQSLGGDDYTNDPYVRIKLREMWNSEEVNKGHNPVEGGYYLTTLEDGQRIAFNREVQQYTVDAKMSLNLALLKHYGAHAHSHPTNGGVMFKSGPELSEADKSTVLKSGAWIYTFSDKGIWKGYLDENGNVKVIQIENEKWLTEDNPCQ